MRIPLPEHISLQWTTVASAAFMVVELVQGTNFYFALLHMLFLILWIFTFNMAGGFTRASGAYVFWFGLLTIPFATGAKAWLGEAADSNAWTPTLTMAIYTVSMAVMLLAVLITRRLTSNVISVAGRLRAYNVDFRNASIGCSILGLSLPFLLNLAPSGQGTIFSVIRQLNFFTEIGVILGTIAVVEQSNGKRSWGYVNGLPALIAFGIGLANFTKQGMFTPFVCWLIGIAYTQYRLKFWGIVGLVAWCAFAFGVLTPIAQVGRNMGSQSYGEGLAIAVGLMEDASNTYELYKGASEAALSDTSYFGKDIGLFYRLSRFDGDDTLVSYSSKGHYIGYASVGYAFLNWFPHMILPDKEKYAPEEMGGNFYAREVGIIDSNNRNTGVSFGTPAEAFHFGGWQSVILIQLGVWVLLFTSVDLLCGDLRRAPWGLFFALAFAHAAPEIGLLGIIQFIWAGNVGLFCCMIFSTYGAPVIGAMFTQSTRRRVPAPGIGIVTQHAPSVATAP